MLSNNDQQALSILAAYVKIKNDYTWVELDYGFNNIKLDYKASSPNRFASDLAHELLMILSVWYKGGNILYLRPNKVNIEIDYQLKDRGVLSIVRRLFDELKNTADIATATNGEKLYSRHDDEYRMLVKKSMLLINLWDMGEDITYHSLTM